MLKRWFTLLLIAMLPILAKAQSGTVYPIDLSVTMTPPYGTCLKEYVGSDRIVIQALLKDFSKTSDQFVIQLKVTDNRNRVVFLSWFGDYEFKPGEVFTFPMGPNASPVQKSNVLHDLFDDPTHASVKLRNECFDEGAYTFTFQAFERASYPARKIALSLPFSYPVFLQGNTVQPLQIYPYENDVICNKAYEYLVDADNDIKKFATQLGGISYQWQSANPTGMRVGYHLQVVDLGDIENRLEKDIRESAQSAFSKNSYFPVNEIVFTPFYNHTITSTDYSENHAYAWRVRAVTGNSLTESLTYSKEQLSSVNDNAPVRVFYFCGAPGVEKDTFNLVLDERVFNDKLHQVKMDTIKASNLTANAFWRDSTVKDGYCGVNVEIRKKGQEKWTPYFVEKSMDLDADGNAVDNSHNFENLSYNTRYEVRAQYVQCKECTDRSKDCVYAPYSDVKEFLIPSPIDSAVCGDNLPKLTSCEEGVKVPKILAGDTIYANGAKVVVDEVSYPNASDSSIISGTAHLSMPIVKNIQLKMSFSEIQINCAKELVKGKIKSIWDEQTCAMINLDELTGQSSTGGKDNTPSEAKTDTYSSDPEELKKKPAGELLVDGDKVYLKTDNETGAVEIGTMVSLSAQEYQSKNYLAENSHYIEFYNTDKVNNAFDNDSAGWYRKMSQYDYFDAPNNKVILPWLANNPGKIKHIKAREVKKKETIPSFESVMFVIPSGGSYIQLKAEKEIVSKMGKNDTVYDLTVPGWADVTHSTPIFAIARKSDTSSFNDAGKMMVANYAERTHKLNIVSLVGELDNSYKTEAEKALNSIYGKLGVKYEVELSTFDDETINDLLLDGLSIGADDESRWKVETREMNEIRSIYQMKNKIDSKAAYLFVVNHPEEREYESVIEGDMPRNQSVGYLFKDNIRTNIGRLFAHEIGHGVYKFQHSFDYSELPMGSTDNLMDYNGGDFLAHYQWRIMQDSVMFVWKGLQDDQDAFAGASPIPCWALGLGSYAVSELIDEGISALSDDDYEFAKQFREVIKDPISLSFASYVAGKSIDLGTTLYSTCVSEIGNIPADILSVVSGLAKSYAKCSSKSTDEEKRSCWCEQFTDLSVDMIYAIVKQIITYKKNDENTLSSEDKTKLVTKLVQRMGFDKVGEELISKIIEANEAALLNTIKAPLEEAICKSKIVTDIANLQPDFDINTYSVNDEFGIFEIYATYDCGAAGVSPDITLIKDALGEKSPIVLTRRSDMYYGSDENMLNYVICPIFYKEEGVTIEKRFSWSKTFNVSKGGNDNFQYDVIRSGGLCTAKFKVKVPCDKNVYYMAAKAQLKVKGEFQNRHRTLSCPDDKPVPRKPIKRLIEHDDCYDDDVQDHYLVGEKLFNKVYSRTIAFDSKRAANDFRRSVERKYDVPKCSGWEVDEDGNLSFASPKICGGNERAKRLYKIDADGVASIQQDVAKNYYLQTFEFWGEDFDSRIEKRILVYVDGEFTMLPIENYVDHFIMSETGVDFLLKTYLSMTFRAFVRIGHERVTVDMTKCKNHFKNSMSEVVDYLNKDNYSLYNCNYDLKRICYAETSPLNDIMNDIKSCLLTRDEYIKSFEECEGLEGLIRRFCSKMESRHGYLRISHKLYDAAVLGEKRIYDNLDDIPEISCVKHYNPELKSQGVLELMPFEFYSRGTLDYRYEDGLGKYTYYFYGSNCSTYDDQYRQYLGLVFDYEELDNLYSIYLSRMQQYANKFDNVLGSTNSRLVSGFYLRVNQTGQKLPHWWE